LGRGLTGLKRLRCQGTNSHRPCQNDEQPKRILSCIFAPAPALKRETNIDRGFGLPTHQNRSESMTIDTHGTKEAGLKKSEFVRPAADGGVGQWIKAKDGMCNFCKALILSCV
jgi:hypothetical protein